ncbi:hypothetical protein CJ030_MR7G011352 [Morella rubra]|uniref:Kinetochore protein Nuf2 N-terminal domain-containing protein n=1 Tax=Morella rubra TaxID=262757 RepID=A0A6A1V335_9ROSI|nr:hypothetical protein CJ030_MR7G011352 [Morella rubra]
MSKFEWPIMSRSEIVAILAESQIASISEHNLFNPNPEEDHGPLEFAALEQLENPDLHVESARMVKLYNRIKVVLASTECPEKFTLKDLIRPDTGRTEFFLSAILNFGLHRQAKLDFLRPIVDEVNHLEEQQREWEAKHPSCAKFCMQLNAEIEDYNEARERELPLVQDVDAKVKELRLTIAGLNNHQMALRASFRKLKEKTGEMDDKVVHAIERALEEKKSTREVAKNSEKIAMQSYRDKNAIAELYTKVFKKMFKHFGQMQAIQEQDFKALKAKLSDEGVLDKSLEAKLEERQAVTCNQTNYVMSFSELAVLSLKLSLFISVEQLDELRKQLEKERDLKLEDATKDFNNVKLEVESRRRDLEARQKNVEAVVVEAISIKESGAAEVQEFIHKSEEIVKEVHFDGFPS